MWKLVKNKITIRMLAMFACAMLLQGMALSYIGASISARAIERQVYSSRLDTLAQMEKNVETLTVHIQNILQMYITGLPLESTLRYPVVQSSEAFRVALDLQSRAYEYPLVATANSFDIMIYGINGTLIHNEKVYFGTGTDRFTSQEWYETLRGSEGAVLWLPGSGGVFEESPGQSYFTIAALLRADYGDSIYGVMLMRFREDSLYSIFREQSGPGYEVTVVNGEGLVLSSSGREMLGGVYPPDPDGAMATGAVERYSADGEEYRLAGRVIRPFGLRIYALMSQSELTRYNRELFSSITAVTAVCFAVSLAVAMAFTRSLTRPLVGIIQRLRDRRNRLSGTAGEARDDLSLLAAEYDALLEQLETAVIQLDREQDQKRAAELQMLQSQINPHFLYNTLGSIKCLVWTNRTEMIVPITDALINLLENTISKDQEMVTLRHDLQCIADYLVIQRIRILRDIGLSVHCDEPPLLDVMLPKLLLQPIIENCVFHGIEPSGTGGEIDIRISRCNGGKSVNITVRDNGVGISPEKAEESMAVPPAGRLSRIGVRNVRERIRLYYHGCGDMRIFPCPNGGTAVEIVIPLDPEVWNEPSALSD